MEHISDRLVREIIAAVLGELTLEEMTEFFEVATPEEFQLVGEKIEKLEQLLTSGVLAGIPGLEEQRAIVLSWRNAHSAECRKRTVN